MSKWRFSKKVLKQDLLREARILNLHAGAVEMIVEKVAEKVQSDLAKKEIVTEYELTKLVVGELKKYNKDLAYVYANRDKII